MKTRYLETLGIDLFEILRFRSSRAVNWVETGKQLIKLAKKKDQNQATVIVTFYGQIMKEARQLVGECEYMELYSRHQEYWARKSQEQHKQKAV